MQQTRELEKCRISAAFCAGKGPAINIYYAINPPASIHPDGGGWGETKFFPGEKGRGGGEKNSFLWWGLRLPEGLSIGKRRERKDSWGLAKGGRNFRQTLTEEQAIASFIL